jgi:hypothetical protein
MMEVKRCRNPKCQKVLPEGYRHKYCEHCRTEHASQLKLLCAPVLSIVGVMAAAVVKKK